MITSHFRRFPVLLRALSVAACLALTLPAARAATVNPAATLYVSNYSSNSLGTYDATTGAVTNTAFITGGVPGPTGVLAVGNNLFVTGLGTAQVNEYNASTGALVQSAFITGLNQPFGLALSGSNLLVANYGGTTVGAYSAANGAAVNTAFIMGLSTPQAVLPAANGIYVSNRGNNTVGLYSATTGLAVAGFTSPTGLLNPFGLAVLGNNLFIADSNNNRVGQYNAATGALVNANFIVGLNTPTGLYVSGTTLLVANGGIGGNGTTAGAYSALTGTAINASFLTGLSGPFFITSAVPEPSTWALLTLGAGLLGMSRRRHALRDAIGFAVASPIGCGCSLALSRAKWLFRASREP